MESYQTNWDCFSNFKEVWHPNYNVFTYTHEGRTLYYRLRTDTLTYETYAICSYPVLFPTAIETLWEGYEKPVGDVVIPSTVAYNGQSYPVLDVGRCAFAYCDEITNVTVPEGVLRLGNATFYECPRLQSVELPQTIIEWETHTFQGDSALVSVNIPEGITTIPYRTFNRCVSLQSVNIPEGVTVIDIMAFCYCASLQSINIPEGVTSIGEWAFFDCKALTDITLACTTPPTAGEDTFNSYDATIHVPEGTVDSYRQHDIWGQFVHIVDGNSTGIEDNDFKGISIYATGGRIVVEGADGERVQVFNMKGQQVLAAESLPAGIYLVRVGNRQTRKIMVCK
jgi:hypothetical protein